MAGSKQSSHHPWGLAVHQTLKDQQRDTGLGWALSDSSIFLAGATSDVGGWGVGTLAVFHSVIFTYLMHFPSVTESPERERGDSDSAL